MRGAGAGCAGRRRGAGGSCVRACAALCFDALCARLCRAPSARAGGPQCSWNCRVPARSPAACGVCVCVCVCGVECVCARARARARARLHTAPVTGAECRAMRPRTTRSPSPPTQQQQGPASSGLLACQRWPLLRQQGSERSETVGRRPLARQLRPCAPHTGRPRCARECAGATRARH